MIFGCGDTGGESTPAVPVDVGDIANSLRFRANASASLTKTPAAGNRQKFTVSLWVKRVAFGGYNGLFIGYVDVNNYCVVRFNTDNTLSLYNIIGGATTGASTSALFRDPAAFYHLVIAVDSRQATAADRVKIYVNGVQATTTGTPIAQDTHLFFNYAIAHSIGNDSTAGGRFLDGYIARYVFIDNQALTPSTFGYLNTDINEWVSKTQAEIVAVIEAVSNATYDEHFNSVSLLLHMDGTNGSTTFTDVKGKSVSAGGNSQISTAQSKFGGASGLFDGNDYLTSPQHADFDFGTGAYTIECWLRYTSLVTTNIFAASGSGSTRIRFYSNASGGFGLDKSGSGVVFSNQGNGSLTTNTWYHVALCRSGTSARVYVNGTDVGGGTDSTNWTNPATMEIAYLLNGHMDELRVTKGVARYTANFTAPSAAFLENGYDTSFMLDFDDGASTTTLGYDKSNRAHHWTLNNHSLSGVTYDWMLDTPGNSHAILNPLIAQAANISRAGLASGATAVRATYDACLVGAYWEVTAGGSAVTAGTISTTGTTSTTTVTAGKVFGFRLSKAGALDYINITDAGAWTSITTGLTSGFPYGITAAADWNFGQRPFSGSIPGGYVELCQQNFTEGSVRNPKAHFDIKTRAGTAASYSVTGLEFQPDFVWTKSRGRVLDHAIYDSVRGVQKQLESNQTGSETTESTGLTAFNSDGYSGGTLDQMNGTTATNSFIDWMLKAGGAAASNTAGDITSQVSANPSAGFSIVTFSVASAGNHTIGHGLGAVPKFIIVKPRNEGTMNWYVYHDDMTSAAYAIYLNANSAQGSVPTAWNSTDPTSTVFSIGSAFGVYDYVAYCFAEIPGFSKIGIYTGNNSTDGPVIQCGFKPRWIMIKNRDASGSGQSDWHIVDTVRNTYNTANLGIWADSNIAEATYTNEIVDITSSGFKPRGISSLTNSAAGGNHLYIAIADVNGKYSNAR